MPVYEHKSCRFSGDFKSDGLFDSLYAAFWLAKETTECVSRRFGNSSGIGQLNKHVGFYPIEGRVPNIGALKPADYVPSSSHSVLCVCKCQTFFCNASCRHGILHGRTRLCWSAAPSSLSFAREEQKRRNFPTRRPFF